MHTPSPLELRVIDAFASRIAAGMGPHVVVRDLVNWLGVPTPEAFSALASMPAKGWLHCGSDHWKADTACSLAGEALAMAETRATESVRVRASANGGIPVDGPRRSG